MQSGSLFFLLLYFFSGANSYSSEIQDLTCSESEATACEATICEATTCEAAASDTTASDTIASETIPDDLVHILACPRWAEGKRYIVGERVRYRRRRYICLKNHLATVGAGLNPVASPTLWKAGGRRCRPTPTPTPAPSTGLRFSPYKDITINMNWNTFVISTNVTGVPQPLVNVMPSNLKAVTWAFATGECGNETWAGVTPTQVATNVQAMVRAGKQYIISTGGASGAFTCGSDAGFAKFIKTYFSTNMLGVDFDIEAGQTQSDIDNLIQRVKVAQVSFPRLRFSFTLATLGGNSGQSLGSTGVQVMNSIQRANLKNYFINLMTMDYGSPIPTVCTVGSNGQCDMGKSAIQAAKNLNSFWNVPFTQIELTPMIGGNDVQNEVFTLANAVTVSSFAVQNKLAGIHFWSFDRDNDCPRGAASPTCNSYGLGGTLGFTKEFLRSLGL